MTKEQRPKLQSLFLNHVRKERTPLTLYLINGIKLQGNISWYDEFTVLLVSEGRTQLVFKHAISTIQPMRPVRLRMDSGSGIPDEESDTGVTAPSANGSGGPV